LLPELKVAQARQYRPYELFLEGYVRGGRRRFTG
jgi:hypothetical protein